MFIFHKNKGQYSGAKVRPPRLNGDKLGVFATRSPHRPNPVGLTLVQIDKIEGSVIYLLGTDIISGTPVIDIKPYIPQYDMPWNSELSRDDTTSSLKCEEYSSKHLTCATPSNVPPHSASEILSADLASECDKRGKPEASVADWLKDPLQSRLSVVFTARAEQQLQLFSRASQGANYQLGQLRTATELRSALIAVLQADPRSVYRRQHCQHQLYYFTVDVAHVTCWFDGDTVEVLKVQPMLSLQQQADKTYSDLDNVTSEQLQHLA